MYDIDNCVCGVILNFEPCDSCFKNQNKIGFNRYMSCCNRIKRPKLDLLCFSRLQMVVLNDFVLFLKQESGSKARGTEKAFSKALHAGSKVKVFKLFSNSGNLVNLAKSILNSIYTILQAETLIFTCPPFSVFRCQSFRPGGGGSPS